MNGSTDRPSTGSGRTDFIKLLAQHHINRPGPLTSLVLAGVYPERSRRARATTVCFDVCTLCYPFGLARPFLRC